MTILEMLWCSKCSKVLWATVFLEVVSKFTGRHSEFEHSKKLQCLTVKPFVSVFCCLCFLSIMNVESLEEGSHWLHIYISKIPIFAYINIDAFSKQTSCVASTMLASSRNVIIPTPPHPNPMTCVAPSMCASARNMMLRSTDHVCKCKERYHPHPTPPQSHDLRSTDHVCKRKERYHPHPTPPQSHDLRSTDHVCKCKEHDVA